MKESAQYTRVREIRMKLRIQGNSLRLRVTQPELTRLGEGGEVAEIIHFGTELEESLRYTLAVATQAEPVMVNYHANSIAVSITPDQMRFWSQESQVGIYARLDVGATGTLEVAVEKDFKCLENRGEEDRDAFPNPLAGKVC
jgi:hypothetical protein